MFALSPRYDALKSEVHSIDWMDILAAAVIGAFFGLVRGRILHDTLVMIVILLCLFYLGWRCKHDMSKLKEWGLTFDHLGSASLVALGFAMLATMVLGAITFMETGEIKYNSDLWQQMVRYIKGAFPQQFLIFGLVIGNFSKLSTFSGHFRLPLMGGLFFGALHFHAPWQILGTFFLGFFCIAFFLRFRTIIPLIAVHAYLYPLNELWIRGVFGF